MAEKPELSDIVLKDLVELEMFNERARGFYRFDREYFPAFVQEIYAVHYVPRLKPALEPFSQHYSVIKHEMEMLEKIKSMTESVEGHSEMPSHIKSNRYEEDKSFLDPFFIASIL